MAEFTWGTEAFMNGFADQYEHIEVKVDKTRPRNEQYGCRTIVERTIVDIDTVDYYQRFRSLTADELTQLAELGLEHDDDDPAFDVYLADFLRLQGDFEKAMAACKRRRAMGQRSLRAYVVGAVKAYRAACHAS